MNNIDFTELKRKFSYDPSTGILTNLKTALPSGTKNKAGYLTVHFMRKNLYAHRVAWALTYGKFPEKMLDHINGNKTDNRLGNLRLADCVINGHNRKALGITKPKQTKKWAASIMVNYKRKHIGYFDTPELAHKAYLEAKKIHHPSAPH
jgi:hypothetical protein